MLHEIILDIKIVIASFDKDTFYKIWLYDDEFRNKAPLFAKSHINIFKEVINNTTTLFGNLHSFDDKYAHERYNKKEWYYNGKLHRENDKPAVVYNYGHQEWYYNGRLHRENDLPAIIYVSGSQEWLYNGIVHRENDMPAIIYSNGDQEWYYNGKLHRENDMPAIIYSNDRQEWWYNGKRHRLTGHAIIDKVGEYYINDKRYQGKNKFARMAAIYMCENKIDSNNRPII